MSLPETLLLRQDDTHRLILKIYSDEPYGPLRTIAEDPERFAACLSPDSYVASQGLADQLLKADSLGVVYPSVRYSEGTCLACFRPAVVTHVRTGAHYEFTWNGQPQPTIAAIG